MVRLFGGKRKYKCVQDPNTKELICESYYENKDGTRVELAHLRAQVDASCHPVVTEMGESEDGEYDKLEKKVAKKMTSKCRSTPPDY